MQRKPSADHAMLMLTMRDAASGDSASAPTAAISKASKKDLVSYTRATFIKVTAAPTTGSTNCRGGGAISRVRGRAVASEGERVEGEGERVEGEGERSRPRAALSTGGSNDPCRSRRRGAPTIDRFARGVRVATRAPRRDATNAAR
mmetsp:Transcript_8324/g.24804  ORF Transcript_8324/g.24804 Transcript_8324/m.24804 type:complete len:146 (+) Transcript_8324:345-782(+)